MSSKHDAVFDDVLSGLVSKKVSKAEKGKSGTRFLKRGTAISDRLSGQLEEKTLRWVDPAECRMWAQHNRDYELLNENNCRDLIDGIRSQGRQEFPAIVREVKGGGEFKYEVVCGARRHFAVNWLRENNYPQFEYLIEVRDLSDEEAFRLADIENREREDISDYERALDYASAIKLYYGGKQKAMAERIEVSEAWLSRYLQLAKLPLEIIDAFYLKTDIKELHARAIKPIILKPSDREKVLVVAREIQAMQLEARKGQGAPIEASKVVSLLKAAITKTAKQNPKSVKVIDASDGRGKITIKETGKSVSLEFSKKIDEAALRSAFDAYLSLRFRK